MSSLPNTIILEEGKSTNKDNCKEKILSQSTNLFDDRVEWVSDGQLHRLDGPAVEFKNGKQCWYLYGKLHRDDGPAISCPDGRSEWFIKGIRHRKDGSSGFVS